MFISVDYWNYFRRDIVLEKIEDSGKTSAQADIDDAVVAMTTQFGVSQVLKIGNEDINRLL